MSKIDEIIEHINHISFKDINAQVMCVDLKPALQLVEKLRPFVELAELIYANQNTMYIKNYDCKREYDTWIQQIKHIKEWE